MFLSGPSFAREIAAGLPTAACLTASVYRVLYEKKDLGEAVRELVTHPLKSEYD